MTTAIVDYGSGNLHSAHKAFERAAREAGLATTVVSLVVIWGVLYAIITAALYFIANVFV